MKDFNVVRNTNLKLCLFPRHVFITANLVEHIPQLSADPGFVHGFIDSLYDKSTTRQALREATLLSHAYANVQ